MQLGKLQKIEQELKALGFVIVAVSPDRPEKLQATVQKKALTFTLLSDARMQASRAYGIAFRVNDKTRGRYQKFGIDLEDASGETHHLLPVPSVFLIDGKGVIRFVYSNPDYKVRISTDEVLAAARRIADSGH